MPGVAKRGPIGLTVPAGVPAGAKTRAKPRPRSGDRVEWHVVTTDIHRSDSSRSVKSVCARMQGRHRPIHFRSGDAFRADCLCRGNARPIRSLDRADRGDTDYGLTLTWYQAPSDAALEESTHE